MVNVKEETVVRYISIFGNILHKGILVLKFVLLMATILILKLCDTFVNINFGFKSMQCQY